MGEKSSPTVLTTEHICVTLVDTFKVYLIARGLSQASCDHRVEDSALMRSLLTLHVVSLFETIERSATLSTAE